MKSSSALVNLLEKLILKMAEARSFFQKDAF